MNSNEPRLNKLPFILTDLACLGVAALIGLYAKDPFAPLPFLAATILVVAGGIALLVPYLSDYAADSREATARLSDELEMQIKRVQAASESLSRAAAQIKAIEEAVHKSARDAETLPYRMQEKLAEFNEALAEKENEEREALEQELEELRASNAGELKAVADKIAKAAADWTALEVATRKQLTAAETALAKLQSGTADTAAKFDERLTAALRELDAKVTEFEKAARSAPAVTHVKHEEPVAEAKPEPAPAATETAPAVVESALTAAESPTVAAETAPAEPPKPKKPRAPRKPKPEDVMAAMSGDSPAPADQPEQKPAAQEEAAPSENSAPTETAAGIEASTSSDGATRLLATAYIGIGNKLFIRGDGPGLSWDHGIPMQFVSIGKWGWSTQDASGPVRVKLYKNDESAALSGELTLEPGRHTEVTALF